jgi:hypothetical protein
LVMDAVRAEVSHRDVSLIFHVGDVSYGDGKGKVWHAFMQEISTFASSIPYMVGVGELLRPYNHIHYTFRSALLLSLTIMASLNIKPTIALKKVLTVVLLVAF